jgi:monoamine oxidase
MNQVIIIGAGFSGIAAAKKLHEAGISFLVLEARERLGGRVYTKQISEDLYLDLGGQWIGPSQDRMYALCQEYHMDYFETYDQGYNIIDFQKQVKKFKGLIPKLDIISLINLDFVLKKLERLAKSIPQDSPWLHPKSAEFDQVSLAAFVASHCKTNPCRKVVTLALETVFAAELNEVSLLHALFYFKSGRDLNTLINIKNGAQLHRIIGGMQKLVEKMAKPFMDQIKFNHPVISIKKENGVFTIIGESFSFRTKKIIMAIPPVLAGKINFTPMLSAAKRQVLDRIAMGQVGKCFMVYQKPFWREAGFSGQAFADELSPFQSMFDASPKDANYGIILGFTIGNRAKVFFENNKESRKAIMLEKLTSYFGTEAKNPLLYEDFSMTDEAWSRGCYAGLYPTGTWTGFQDAFAKTENDIFWAGTEASKVWFGYIEGAVRAGEVAAENVISDLK